MGVYTMMRTDGWNLGRYWCTFTAYCYSYLEVLYMAHVLMIAIDMLLYQFTNLKDVVKVGNRNQPNQEILVSDWFIASHVT